MPNFALFTKVHRFLYHHTRGVIGGNLGAPMVLMYTIGAKTGASRPVPLQYYPHPDGILVLGSNNGQAKAPGWYFNLKAHPDIDIRVGREKRRVSAEQLSPDQAAADHAVAHPSRLLSGAWTIPRRKMPGRNI